MIYYQIVLLYACFMQGITGFGFAVIAAPLLLLAFAPQPLVISFILISLIGLVRMALGSFLVRFSDEEKHFLSSKFPSLRGQRARQFLDAGT